MDVFFRIVQILFVLFITILVFNENNNFRFYSSNIINIT